jgi:hypothetical protein
MSTATSSAPSLFGATGPGAGAGTSATPAARSGVLIADAHSLLDLM